MRLNDTTNVMCLTLSLFPFSPYSWRFFSTGHLSALDNNRSPNTPAGAGNSASQFPGDMCKCNLVRGRGEMSFQCKSSAISSQHIPETQLAQPTPLRFWNTGLKYISARYRWNRVTVCQKAKNNANHCLEHVFRQRKYTMRWFDKDVTTKYMIAIHQ